MVESPVRADMILRQIEKRHRHPQTDDAFFTEVKNGPTFTSRNLLIMDAVAIKKSWTKPCITGYEVKISRQDFLRDTKWPGYLNYCHQFYFACPNGLIKHDELPETVGLIYYNPEKDCIHIKKRAVYRPIEMPWEMFYYLIISRLKRERHPFFSSQREYLMALVEDRADRKELGLRVKIKVIETLEKENKELKRENTELKTNLEGWEEVKKLLAEHGIYYDIPRKLKDVLKSDVPINFKNAVARLVYATKDIARMSGLEY